MRLVNVEPDFTSVTLNDAFINVSLEDDTFGAARHGDKMYAEWVENSSARHSAPEVFATHALRKIYPKHSLVSSAAWLNVLGMPGVYSEPLQPSELIMSTVFIPLARRAGAAPGLLAESVEFGAFNTTWEGYQFIIYIAKWLVGFSVRSQTFVLHEGSEDPARDLILASGIFDQQLHDEIWVFDQGFWSKNQRLWAEVQKADWDDVILKQEFKNALRKDVLSFFKSEDVYKRLSIPWKRGLIMYGPPGNGKTISIKAILKAVQEQGHSPLYAKSFQSWAGAEAAMAMVFDKARQESPCVVILEDIDSLINDNNRSFFLNQLDGLEDNEGLLVIGTTNHFERLDPGLSTRPSRFDRKYLFDDPDREERQLYALYWQNKLCTNPEIKFPDSLVDDVADMTSGFSFAYLKEAFVSTLVLMASDDKKKFAFESQLKQTIKDLKEQLDKNPPSAATSGSAWVPLTQSALPPKPEMRDTSRNITMRGATAVARKYIY